MHKTFTTKSIVAVIIAGAGLLAAAPAFALSIGGFSGKPYAEANATCLSDYNGGVANNCGSQVFYEIPLAVNQGSHTVTVGTYNAGGGQFFCTAYAETQAGVLTTGTTQYPNTGNQTIQLTVSVPANGSMYVFCSMNPSARIYNVNYSQ